MTLDPQAQLLLDKAKAAGAPPVYMLPVQQARERMEALFKQLDPPEALYLVKDLLIACPVQGLPVRLYKPTEDKQDGCLVFIHGGGWSVNSLETHDALCRRLAVLGNCSVISVGHRMSPEFKYPAALEDTFTALQWAFNNGQVYGWESTNVAIGGDSSGGTLATAAAMLNRDRNGPAVKYQLLIYPVTDYYLPGSLSYQENSTGYSLNRDFMIWFWQNYLPASVELNDPYLCPLRAESLENMPPTLIITAQFDPLRDEGTSYADRLRASGVEVDHWHLEDQMHGFIMQTAYIDRARVVLEQIGAKLADVFRKPRL